MIRKLMSGPEVGTAGARGSAVPPVGQSSTTRVLLGLLVFGAVSAVAGLVIAVPGGGAGFPLSALEGTPFTSFVVPGLILGVVVGGTQLAAAVAVARGRASGLFLAAVAGCGMLIWIFTELAMIGYSVLQTIYFALGLLELVLVVLLLGVVPPRRPRRAR